jgi:glucose-6-phosphate isomerase
MWQLTSSEKLDPKTKSLVQAARDQLFARTDLGYINPLRYKESLKTCQNHLGFFAGKDHLFVIGLGGSSLGTKALCASIEPYGWHKKLSFIDNVDASHVDHILSEVKDPNSVGWLLCSKSGSTIEVLSAYEYIHHFFKQHFQYSILANTAVISEDKASPLTELARQHGLNILNMPMDVGGRFSAFTSIGLYPLSFIGVKLDDLVDGVVAGLADSSNSIDLASILYQSITNHDHSFYSFQYCDRLIYWSEWLQQLWSESLAKKQTRSGLPAPILPSLITCRGASAQHSVLQQTIEGRESKLVGFHRVASSEISKDQMGQGLFPDSPLQGRGLGQLMAAEATATELSAQQAGLKTFCLRTDELTPYSISYLMGLWMSVIGILGESMDINAFNQPGVESGKLIARRVLSQVD